MLRLPRMRCSSRRIANKDPHCNSTGTSLWFALLRAYRGEQWAIRWCTKVVVIKLPYASACARTHVRSHPNSELAAKFHCIDDGLRAWIIIIEKSETCVEKGAPFSCTTRALPRNSILKTSNHPAIPVDCAITRQFANGLCSRKEGTGGRKGNGTYAHATTTQLWAAASNSSRLSAISLVSRCGICICATGFYTEPLRYLCNHECVGISPSSPSPSRAVRFNTSCILDGFARTRYPPQGDERLLIGYRCNFLQSCGASCCVAVSLEFDEIIFSCVIQHARRKCSIS